MSSSDLSNVCTQLGALGLNILPSSLASLSAPLFFRGKVCLNENYLNECIALDAYSCVGCFCELRNFYCGRYCSIGNFVRLGLGIHAIDELSTSATMYAPCILGCVNRTNSIYDKFKRLGGVVTIGDDVHINNNVSIVNDVEIGCGAVILPNAVVTKDIPPFAIVGGYNKIVGYHYHDEVISDLLDIRWWEFDLPKMEQFKIKVPRNTPHDFIQFFKNLDDQHKIKLPEHWIGAYLIHRSLNIQPMSKSVMLSEFKQHMR